MFAGVVCGTEEQPMVCGCVQRIKVVRPKPALCSLTLETESDGSVKNTLLHRHALHPKHMVQASGFHHFCELHKAIVEFVSILDRKKSFRYGCGDDVLYNCCAQHRAAEFWIWIGQVCKREPLTIVSAAKQITGLPK